MKRNKIILLSTSVLVILVLVYCVWDYFDAKRIDKARDQFSEIKIGMTQQQVINILGKPDTIIYGRNPTSMEFDYFTKETRSPLSSGSPAIFFDSNGVVSWYSFDW